MTRDQAIIAVATAHGIKAAHRAVLLAVLADSAAHPEGHALVASVEAVVRRSGIPRSSTWLHLAALEGEGAISRAGGAVVVLDSWLMGCVENNRPATGQTVQPLDKPSNRGTVADAVATVQPLDKPSSHWTNRPATGRSEPSRTRAPDSLLVQDSKESCTGGEREVVDHLAGEREREAVTHTLLGEPDESQSLPVIEADPEAPHSLTPPPPPWAPDSPIARPGRAAGYAVAPEAPGRAYTPGPVHAGPPPASAAGLELHEAPSTLPPPMVQAMAAWEKALEVTTLRQAVADRVAANLALHGLAAVIGGAERARTYLAEKPQLRAWAQGSPKLVDGRCADEADAIKATSSAAPARRGGAGRVASRMPTAAVWADPEVRAAHEELRVKQARMRGVDPDDELDEEAICSGWTVDPTTGERPRPMDYYPTKG